ncbi:MAG: hypothetical protein AAB694_01100 [Patescibacteria group bacterium]
MERRHLLIQQFGPSLGEALSNYIDEPSTYLEVAQNRRVFAEAIVSALETGTHEEKVRGLNALLTAIEEKIDPVARKAEHAYSLVATIR